MSTQRINLTTSTPTHPGRISTIRLVSQAVTGPPGADGAGVSVALKEGGTTKVAVATVLDFTAADFDVTTGGVVSLATTPQPLDSDLTAIAALASAADKVPYSTGAGTWALADFSAAGRALVDDANAAVQRTTLGLGTAATAATGDFATAAQGATADAAVPLAQAFNAQTGTTYTLVAGDAGKCVSLSNASAITLTLPQDSDATIAVGVTVDLYQLGAGQVTVVAGSGATLRVSGLTAKARAQFSRLAVQKVSANTWSLFGDLAAS